MKVQSIQQRYNLKSKNDSPNNNMSVPSFGLGGLGKIDPPKKGELGFFAIVLAIGLGGVRVVGDAVGCETVVKTVDKIGESLGKACEKGWL